MNLLYLAILAFVVLEFLNVVILSFSPSSLRGNGVGAFKTYAEVKSNPELESFVNYLVNWIAGTKLIFIALLIVVLALGDDTLKWYCILIPTGLTYFWRLHPAIQKMDERNQITPKGYSKTLAWMIIGFVTMFVSVIFIHLYS